MLNHTSNNMSKQYDNIFFCFKFDFGYDDHLKCES